jgi:hypothetical protein
MPRSDLEDKMLNSKEAAKYLGISVYYLRNMRQLLHNHDGPAFTKGHGRNKLGTRYKIEDLDKWKKEHKNRKEWWRGKKVVSM